jgi:hypothetical protein
MSQTRAARSKPALSSNLDLELQQPARPPRSQNMAAASAKTAGAHPVTLSGWRRPWAAHGACDCWLLRNHFRIFAAEDYHRYVTIVVERG